MVSDQDADIPLAQVPDDPLDVEDGYRVYAGEGFVKQHEQGIRCECPCDFDTASLATRQTNSEARTNVAYVQLIEQNMISGFEGTAFDGSFQLPEDLEEWVDETSG